MHSVFESTARLSVREYSHDYLDIAPGDGSDLYAGLYWSGAAEANRPKLTIKYKI